MCTAQSRDALCVYCNSREALFVYCPVQIGTLCVLLSLERHCVCSAQCREALFVYCTF